MRASLAEYQFLAQNMGLEFGTGGILNARALLIIRFDVKCKKCKQGIIPQVPYFQLRTSYPRLATSVTLILNTYIFNNERKF